jgi:plastocyanin
MNMRKTVYSLIASLVILTISSVPSFAGDSVFAQNTTKALGASMPYYLFPAEIEGVEEEILKIPHDAFTLQTIVANKGENVTIKFYNTEANEAHTFTLDAPYNINKDLIGGQNSTINFVADKEGIFTYYCIYHLPTMTGKLVVLP